MFITEKEPAISALIEPPPKDNDRHVYARIAADITEQIRSGELKPGTLLPGRRELSKQYGVALGTTQQAVGMLVAAGLLVADNRRGTYVSGGRAMRPAPAAGGAVCSPRRPLASSTVGIFAVVRVPEPAGESDNGSKLSIRGLEHVLSERKIATTFSNLWASEDSLAALELKVRVALDSGVDALAFVFPGNNPEIIALAARLAEKSQVPAVVVARDLIDRAIPHIFYDQDASGYQAATHLLDRGFEKLVFLAPYTADWVEERIARARKACANAGLGEDAVTVIWPERDLNAWSVKVNRRQYCDDCVRFALDGRELEGAGVIAADDFVAVALVEECHHRGIVAGEHFSLVSFDDIQEARKLGISSLRPPFEAMGAEGARLLIRLMQGEMVNAQVRLNSQLIIRNSSRLSRHDWSSKLSPPEPRQ